MKHVQHFVFGYGSLICSHSRSLTVPEHAAHKNKKVATPVVVRGMERIWAKRSTAMGMTAMGVRFRAKASCVGVLMEVDPNEVAQLDERETGYTRFPLHLDKVDMLDFVDYGKIIRNHNHNHHQYQQQHHHHAHVQQHRVQDHDDSFLSIKEANRHDRIQIWVYVQQESHPPTRQYPIAQSYVDTILRGCLGIHPEFAKQFLVTTKGWSLTDFHHPEQEVLLDNKMDGMSLTTSGMDDDSYNESSDYNISCSDDDDRSTTSSHSVGDSIGGSSSNSSNNHIMSSSSSSSWWINDRHDPIYTRGDPKWSLQYSRHLDALIQKYHPLLFHKRQQQQQSCHRRAHDVWPPSQQQQPPRE